MTLDASDEEVDDTDDGEDRDGSLAPVVSTHAPLARVETVPASPLRMAMRDEVGRRAVGAAIGAGAAVLPGLALAIVGGLVAWRVVRAIRARVNAWRSRSDASIGVKVIDGARREGGRVVDASVAGVEHATARGAEAPVDPAAAHRARRAAFLRRRRARA